MQENLISILVSNHFGVLMRITTIFSRRTCNIQSLTVAETQSPEVSRITILFEATPELAWQIHKLLEKQEDVKEATLLPINMPLVRKLVLVKVKKSPQLDADLKELTTDYTVRVISETENECVIEFVGTLDQTDNFQKYMERYGIIEICHVGSAAVSEGRSGGNQ